MSLVAVVLIFIFAYLKAFVSPDIMPFLYFFSVLLTGAPIVAYALMERKPKSETPPALADQTRWYTNHSITRYLNAPACETHNP